MGPWRGCIQGAGHTPGARTPVAAVIESHVEAVTIAFIYVRFYPSVLLFHRIRVRGALLLQDPAHPAQGNPQVGQTHRNQQSGHYMLKIMSPAERKASCR